MRRFAAYVKVYGPEAGPKPDLALQNQAAQAGVSARLRRKLDTLPDRAPALPRFPETVAHPEFGPVVLEA